MPASPTTVTTNPARTNRSGGQRVGAAAWIQAPAVQAIVAAVRAIPACGRGQAAPVDEGQRDVGVDAEEREGQDAAQQDRGGQDRARARACPAGSAGGAPGCR